MPGTVTSTTSAAGHRRVPLGGTGTTISAIGLGTAPIGSRADGPLWWGPQDEGDSVRTIHAAVDAGMDWIDTAPFYGWGEAERIVGEAVQALGEDRPRLFTKCGTVRDGGGEVREDLRPDTIRSASPQP